MMKFAKYHGCGNDFIIVNQEDLGNLNYAKVAQKWCHRHAGVGADGLIIVKRDSDSKAEDSPSNLLEMVIYNSDGSYAPMCGNGIRCFANYCYDEGIESSMTYPVKTGAGILTVNVKSVDPFMVEIDMGKPDFTLELLAINMNFMDLVTNSDGSILYLTKSQPEDFVNKRIRIDEWEVTISTFFMGTIHTVVWDEDIHAFDKAAFAERLSNHPIFEEKTNVNMVKIIDRNTIEVTTFERGAGLTAACGTGACASVVMGIREGRLNSKVKVILPLGELIITQKDDGTVLMEGPAIKVAEGCLFV
jgi:diaminopimelate epimerase